MIRLLPALLGALLLNLLLFMTMSGMVRLLPMPASAAHNAVVVDFFRAAESEPPPAARTPSPPTPPEPLEPLPLPLLDPLPTAPVVAPRLVAPKVDLDASLDIEHRAYLGEMSAPEPPRVMSARELVAVATPSPRYPVSARSRRVEGFVEAEFSVRTDGTTADVRILDSEPAGAFDRATERAILRWRFQPHRVDGKAVEVRVRQRVAFRLEGR